MTGSDAEIVSSVNHSANSHFEMDSDTSSVSGVENIAAAQPGPFQISWQFSEARCPWQAVPSWVTFLLKCGFIWAERAPSRRRISFISMPCDSAAAGLIALGAICRRLTLDGADDSAAHYQRLECLAQGESGQVFVRSNTYRGRYKLEYTDGLLWGREGGVEHSRFANRTRNMQRIAILPPRAFDWYIDGEAPIQAIQGAELHNCDFYEEVIRPSSLLRSNLNHSDSGICLAGRVAGKSASRSVFEDIRFRNHDRSTDLSQLLTVQSWSPGTISRMTFFNTLTSQHDRNPGLTRLVIADGDGAFLKVIEAPEFASSDIVGVIHRVIDRDKLDAIGVKISSLAQWYAPESDLLNQMPAAPTGITISTFSRR